jgi:antitoxin CptB
VTEKSRLRWQCRRGMRELDILLQAYLDERYEESESSIKAAFRQLLELPDPELAAYLLKGELHREPALASVVREILGETAPERL